MAHRTVAEQRDVFRVVHGAVDLFQHRLALQAAMAFDVFRGKDQADAIHRLCRLALVLCRLPDLQWRARVKSMEY